MLCATFQEQLLSILDNPVEMFHETVLSHSVRIFITCDCQTLPFKMDMEAQAN